MKIKETGVQIIKNFEVDYENGIICKYTTINNKLSKYEFLNSTKNLTYVENIEDLKNAHWYKHWEMLKNQKITITTIKKFEDFDKLFYVGGGQDGNLKDKDGNFISSPIYLDYIFSHCWLHIETKKEKCQKILDSLNNEYIIESKIEEIPYYNQNDDKKHHYTISLMVKLPDDIYNKFLSGKKYLDDMTKAEIFNFLKNKE